MDHVINKKHVWGFLVSGGCALDNPVFLYSEKWGEAEPDDKPAAIAGLSGWGKPAKVRYQKRTLWQYKYENMAHPKWADAESAFVVLQEAK